MSDGQFVVPIVTEDGQIIAWGRGQIMVSGAAHHKEIGTDLRFLRYANGEVLTIPVNEQEVIIAADQQAAEQAIADAQAAALASQQAAEQATTAQEAIVAAHDASVAAIREQYRGITRTICQLAGVAVCDKFATVGGVADVVMQYGMGDNALRLTQYALFLKATLDELRRMDGDDAWERI